MSELTTGGINFESPFAYRLDKEAVEKHDKAIRKSFEKAFAVAELEKIKDKIEWEVKGQTVAIIKAYKVIEIIDNHIKELKGENNE